MMGYDISFHPISPKEMEEWYFAPLEWVRWGQEQKILELAANYGMEKFYAQKYLDTLRVGANTKDNELFDKSHGFYLAVVQGFFRNYFYIRGSAFTFLIEQKPEYSRYTTPWTEVTPRVFPNPVENRIVENYCAGVYFTPGQVKTLLQDLKHNPQVQTDMEQLWSDGQIGVLKKALVEANDLRCGLLEATEVVEPNPFHPNKSSSYSNLSHCDWDGVSLYIDTAIKQISQIMENFNK